MPDAAAVGGGVLPGFEFVMDSSRPGERDLSDGTVYTGEVLFRRHPDVFKAVAVAFFIDGLSIRAVAARFRVSVNTVRAIRDMVLEDANTDAKRAAFFIKSKADKLRGLIRTRSLEVIYDRLSDPKSAADIPLDTLIELCQRIDLGDHQKDHNNAEIIDAEEFDDILNGLEGEEKNARDESAEFSEDRSKNAADNVQNSVEQSDGSAENKGRNEILCNPACNLSKDDGLKAPHDQGGEGAPGVSRDGGVTL